MFSKNDEKSLFSRRVKLFALLNFALISTIVVRLVYLQIYQSEKYKILSDKNRIVISRVLPLRGNITDERMKIIATNTYSYSVVLDTYKIDRKQIISIIEKLKDQSIDEKALTKLKNLPDKINNNNRYISLKENANWSTLAQYYILSNFYPNIIIKQTALRHYINPYEMSHILGYISSPSKFDVKNSDNLALSIPTAKIGKCGIEKYYEKSLFGKIGIKELEVNSKRQIVRTINEKPSTPGETLELTINADLQHSVYKILSEQISGVCIVMDIETGAILALVSYPGYDINVFSKQVSHKLLQRIYSNPAKPLINKAVSGLYAPGSTFKIITALAGLHYGVITKKTRFFCPGYCSLGKHKFYCWKWKYGGHGSLTVQEALEQSCDCFFYNLSSRLNPDNIAKVANDFGLGCSTGIDIPNERSGLIPTRTWKYEKRKQKWTTGDSYNMSIGQGYVLTTPIQLVKMVAVFVNGLRSITPHLYKNFKSDSVKPLEYNNEHIQVVIDGMYDVVNSPMGTARKSAIKDERFEFAGKTGSSQVRRISSAQRALGKTVSDLYEQKDHALFIAFAPADYPKYAVCVVIEHGGGGASVAAPIARNVLLETRRILEANN